MKRSNRLSPRRLNLETLEDRVLKAADITLAAGVLKATGTDNADIISFGPATRCA